MNRQWRKLAGDFRQHRLQVALIGVVLILGTAGVVAALNARVVLEREIDASYRRAKSPDIALWFDRVDEGMLEQIQRTPGLAAADARRMVVTRVEGRGGAWVPTRLLVVRDFSDQRTGLIHRHKGPCPAPDAGLLIEQSSLSLLAANPGESLRVRTPGGALFEATVSKPEGFLIDETYEKMGSDFQVPPIFAGRRDEILEYLEPIVF